MPKAMVCTKEKEKKVLYVHKTMASTEKKNFPTCDLTFPE